MFCSNSFGSITLPQKEDPRHTQLIKRCENARPIGMFRSTEDEFLLCYDGMLRALRPVHPFTNLNEKNSDFTWTNMVTLRGQETPSSGKGQQNELHSITHTSYSLIPASLRYATSPRVDLRRSSLELTSGALGMAEADILPYIRMRLRRHHSMKSRKHKYIS